MALAAAICLGFCFAAPLQAATGMNTQRLDLARIGDAVHFRQFLSFDTYGFSQNLFHATSIRLLEATTLPRLSM